VARKRFGTSEPVALVAGSAVHYGFVQRSSVILPIFVVRGGLCENHAMSSLTRHDRDQRGAGQGKEPEQRRIFRQIGRDLRHGDNIELYVTVTLSLCIALLSVLGVVDVKVVSGTTLAVLALLAASGLATRRRSEVVEGRLEQLTAT
jgi:hypothetical protein